MRPSNWPDPRSASRLWRPPPGIVLDFAAARMLVMQRILLLALFLVGFALPAWADYDSGYKAYKKGDYGTALEELLPPAKQGDPKAQRVIGAMYADGLGVDQDYAAAAKWYQLAADQNYAPAMA